ncbi:MAG TPA: cytochrome b562 [Humisphaera sp.]|jgi:glycerol-3-phosphate O-acyltransferase|nr:cytochrome b562 [Humisphaera sp.]
MSSFKNGSAVRITLLSLALCCMAAPRVGLAEEKKKSELNNRMEEMDASFKKLKSSIRNAQQDAQSLELISKIEQLAITCKAMTPSKAATVPADKRDAFLLGYRKEMAHLVADMCAMETALLDGDRAKAQELYKKLTTDKEDGHDKFLDDDAPDKAK